MEIEGTSEMTGVAVTSWTVLDVAVGVGLDGDIWFGQCVNVLLLYSACSFSTFSFVHTLQCKSPLESEHGLLRGIATTY